MRSLEALRKAVRDAAAEERAPEALDALVDPLLRGNPPTSRSRPWAHWLATAAAVVLAATVSFEIVRRAPRGDHHADSHPSQMVENRPTEIFRLAPLPTSSLPEEERPLGVSDRLLASPIPEVEVDDPPPLEVMGPLSGPESEDAIEGDAAAWSGEPDDQELPTLIGKGRRAAAPPPAPLAQGREDRTTADDHSRVTPPHAVWGDRAPRAEGQLFVFLDGQTVWRRFEPSSRCRTGRYTVRIEVAEGKIVGVWPLGAATSPTPEERLCAANLLQGLEASDVPDGEHRAEVLLESSAETRR
jgi:hypothetical protein